MHNRKKKAKSHSIGEKQRMKTIKKTTAAGVALAATAGLVAGPVMGMSQAWAAETGTITINKVADNNTATYGAVKIFNATVSDDGKVSNIEWASDDIKTAVLALLPTEKVEGGLPAYTGKTAQEAAEYIAENMGSTGEGAILGKDELGMKIANALKGKTTETITPGDAATLAAGYWLVIPTGGDGEGASASSPIFATIGGPAVTVTEKTSVPTIEKTVKEDSTGAYGDDADHTLGQEVEYRLVGTVSANFASFETYQYNFHDTFGAGLDMVYKTVGEGEAAEQVPDVTVTVDGKDITDNFTIAFADQVLTINCTNLVGIEGITAGSKIQVDYKAIQNGTAAAETGIENEAYIEYTHAPGSTETSKTTTDKAKDYSYALKMVKTDSMTGEALAGAKFTVQAKGGKYIGIVDGKLREVDTAYEFSTGADGLLTLDGIDAGTYVITETQAPDSYQKLAAPFEVTIDASNRSEVTKNLATGTDTLVQAVAGDATGVLAGATHEIKNRKESNLPITGEAGVLAIFAIGSAVVIASSIFLARRRKADNED